MAVYVDDMKAKYGQMIMCHMLADTDEELHAMAARIGVARRWHQKAGTPHSHYDICMSKRALALKFGAQQVDPRGVVAVIKKKRAAQATQTPVSERPLCGVAVCIGCGCHDFHACAGGCWWSRVDYSMKVGVCSQCKAHVAAWDAGHRTPIGETP